MDVNETTSELRAESEHHEDSEDTGEPWQEAYVLSETQEESEHDGDYRASFGKRNEANESGRSLRDSLSRAGTLRHHKHSRSYPAEELLHCAKRRSSAMQERGVANLQVLESHQHRLSHRAGS